MRRCGVNGLRGLWYDVGLESDPKLEVVTVFMVRHQLEAYRKIMKMLDEFDLRGGT